jgi:hypothetical protein
LGFGSRGLDFKTGIGVGDEGNTPLCPGGRAESNNLKDHQYTACDCGNLIDSPDGHLGVVWREKGWRAGGVSKPRTTKALDNFCFGVEVERAECRVPRPKKLLPIAMQYRIDEDEGYYEQLLE